MSFPQAVVGILILVPMVVLLMIPVVMMLYGYLHWWYSLIKWCFIGSDSFRKTCGGPLRFENFKSLSVAMAVIHGWMILAWSLHWATT